jgi:hypothetical protein
MTFRAEAPTPRITGLMCCRPKWHGMPWRPELGSHGPPPLTAEWQWFIEAPEPESPEKADYVLLEFCACGWSFEDMRFPVGQIGPAPEFPYGDPPWTGDYWSEVLREGTASIRLRP